MKLLKYTGFAGISWDFGEPSKSAQKLMGNVQKMRIIFCEVGRDVLLFVKSRVCAACLIGRSFLSWVTVQGVKAPVLLGFLVARVSISRVFFSAAAFFSEKALDVVALAEKLPHRYLNGYL